MQWKHFVQQLLCMAVLAGATRPSLATANGDGTTQPAWTQRMLELSATLSTLVPDLVSDERFNDPNNAARITQTTKKLAFLAHNVANANLNGALAPPDPDPTLQMIGGLFATHVQQASNALAQGHRAYARRLLQSSIQYCVGCHTRSDRPIQAPALDWPEHTASLAPLEQADCWLATHQYDRALKILLKAMKEDAITLGLHWHEAVLRAINVAVRIQHDPAQASAVVDQVLQAKTAPQYVREEAYQWRDAIGVWRKETKATQQPMAEAKRLISYADAHTRYPWDHSQDILYLRASALVHDYLRSGPTGQRLAEGLLMAGQTYQHLGNYGPESLPEFYYEACVRAAPHSKISRDCYLRFEELIFDAFADSSGVKVPPEVAAQLTELEQKSRLGQQRPGDATQP